MVKKSNKHHRKQTRSEFRKKKKTQHVAFQHHETDFAHPAIKAAWDKEKTLQQNYRALGLIGDPNAKKYTRKQTEALSHTDISTDTQTLVALNKKRRREDDDGDDDEEEERGNDSDDVNDDAVDDDHSELSAAARALHAELTEVSRIATHSIPYQVKSMSLNEQRRIQKLIEKHGKDHQVSN